MSDLEIGIVSGVVVAIVLAWAFVVLDEYRGRP